MPSTRPATARVARPQPKPAAAVDNTENPALESLRDIRIERRLDLTDAG